MNKVKVIILITLSVVPFLSSLDGNFVFDDSEAIIKNKDITSESWLDPFYNDFWGTNITSNLSHKSYRPLTIISYRLNYFLNNKVLSASQFKAVNLVLHCICCLLIWLTYSTIWKRIKTGKSCIDVPYLSSLLFSVHPVHIEAVSGIVGRADLLAAITFFLTLILYNKAMDENHIWNIYLLLSLLLSVISMLFKENGITVLGVCCLFDILTTYNIKKGQNGMYENKTCIKRIVLIVCSSILFLYGRWIVMDGTKPEFKPVDNPAAFADNIFIQMATLSYIYFLNALILMWPQWLCYDWSMGCVPLIKDIMDYRIIFLILLFVYGMLFLFKCVNLKSKLMNRKLILAFLLIAIPFLPAANILYPVGFVIAERILYIPSTGYCLLICIGLEKIHLKSKNKYSLVLFHLTLCVFALKSWQRAYDWSDEYKLFLSGLTVCPLNAKVHYNVAKVVDARNDRELAISEYKTAISLFPEYYQAMNNLANLLKNKKQYSEAEAYLRAALHYKNDFPAAWMNLGIVLANTKRYNESEKAYKMALTYRSKYPDCYYNLGNLYLDINNIEEALEHWFKAVELNPLHVSAWTNILALLDNTGKVDKALKLLPKALKDLPNAPSIHFAVGNIYGKINEYEAAERHFTKAIELFEDKVQAIHYANLGVLYHRWNKYNLAIQMYDMALSINPDFPSAKKNLATLIKSLNI